MASLEWIETLGMGTDLEGVQITANSTINTLGSYTNIGSTASDTVAFLYIVITNFPQTTAFLIDVAADEAGGSSYTNFVQRIPAVGATSGQTSQGNSIVIPLPIPFASGTQFAARCQSDISSANIDVHMVLYKGTTPFTVEWVESMGTSTSTSRGVSVDPGATTSTKGAYAELVSSASATMDYLMPLVIPQPAQTTFNGGKMVVDVSTGVAASEVVKVGDLPVSESVREYRIQQLPAIEVDIPSSVRVAVRLQSRSGTAGRREADVSVIGFIKSSVGGAGGIAHIVGGGGIVG